MPKFKFICEHDENTKVEFTCNEDFLPDVVETFENFLKGSGYSFDFLNIENEDRDLIKISGDNMNESFDPEEDFIFYDDFSQFSEDDIIKFETPKDLCPVCKLHKETMNGHTCYDDNCPINSGG